MKGIATALLVLCAPLLAQEKPRLVVQTGHTDFVRKVVVAPNGRYVATGSDDKTVRLWETATGREIRRIDGYTIRVPAEKLRGPRDKRKRNEPEKDGVLVRLPIGSPRSIAFSRDSRHLVIAHRRGALVLDLNKGSELHIRCDSTDLCVFSPDGRVLTLKGERARLWDRSTGKEAGEFKLSGAKGPMALSHDGAVVVAACNDGKLRLWGAKDGSPVPGFAPDAGAVLAVAAGEDAVAAAYQDGTARVWNRADGTERFRAVGHRQRINAVTFSDDGKLLLTGSHDKTARLWDAKTGEARSVLKQYFERGLRGHYRQIWGVAFTSSDGRHAVTVAEDAGVVLWDTATGKELRRFGGMVAALSVATFSPDGSHALTGGLDDTAHLWDLDTGQQVRRFKHWSYVTAAVISHDNRYVVTGSSDKTARLWEVATGKEIRRIGEHGTRITACAISRDNRFVAAASDSKVRVWDRKTGVLRWERLHDDAVYDVAFSPDGKLVLTGCGDHHVRLWRWQSDKQVWKHKFQRPVYAVAFSPDGTHFIAGAGSTRRWYTATQKPAGTYPHAVMDASFSADGKLVVTAGLDSRARIYDAESGAVRLFEGHTEDVRGVSLSPDGRFLLTGSRDRTARIWDVAKRTELCRLISFKDGSWAVVQAYDGRYDASNGGDVNGMHWAIGNESIFLGQLKERYYEPGLLAKVLGRMDEPLRDVDALGALPLYPAVEVARNGLKLRITVTNRGGGIGRVVIRINGKERTSDARPNGDGDADKPELVIETDLTNDPRILAGGRNNIDVFAFNKEGYLRSRGGGDPYDAPGKTPDPRLFAVVAGVSDYRGTTLDLRFAAKDAKDFSNALRAASLAMFQGQKAEYVTLLENPTRAQLMEALDGVRGQARASDILVVYLSGHGVSRDDDFFYLAADAASAHPSDTAVRNATQISGAELTEAIRNIPALKQVLILDTCASGAVVKSLTEARSVSSGHARALQRVKDRTGMYVLAGSASDKVSYEASRFGQGLLTYSLLLGMKGGALKAEDGQGSGDYVDVAALLSFAVEHVPVLARQIGGVQAPLTAEPAASSSFAIGKLDENDRRQHVRLEERKPLFLSTRLVHETEFDDLEGLEKPVDQALRDETARGRYARAVFLPVDEFPDGYRIAGRYKRVENTLTVTFKVRRGASASAWLTVTGNDLAQLAKAIVDKALANLPG